MAHFYGTLQGNRGQASRQGSKDSGLTTYTASWQGAVRTRLWYDAKRDCDMALVELTEWQGCGVSKVLYEGPVGGEAQE